MFNAELEAKKLNTNFLILFDMARIDFKSSLLVQTLCLLGLWPNIFFNGMEVDVRHVLKRRPYCGSHSWRVGN